MKDKRYTVIAGRIILRDGEPFIGITREGKTNPVDADEVTHAIAAFLNDNPGAYAERGKGAK